MTVFDLYKMCGSFLENGGIDDSAEEARLITEFSCEISHDAFLLQRTRNASDEELQKAVDLCKRRISGIPIQYILGEWEFMGLSFSVGEGVLIPRPETEMLCEYVIEKIKKKAKPIVFDLCSGSGCIGLSIKHFVPQSEVYLLEKSNSAIRFLELNRTRLGLAQSTVCIKGDVLQGYEKFSFLPRPDVIVSNPPYIKSADIDSLQKEVKNEPTMALDGGEDGLIFYRALSEKWLSCINTGGFIAVECGEDQAKDISGMFSEKANKTVIINDFNNTQRFVAAEL